MSKRKSWGGAYGIARALPKSTRAALRRQGFAQMEVVTRWPAIVGDYLAARSALIDPAKAMARAEPGTPPGVKKRAALDELTRPGTTHLSIIDADGNAVSMTSSVEGGSRISSRCWPAPASIR